MNKPMIRVLGLLVCTLVLFSPVAAAARDPQTKTYFSFFLLHAYEHVFSVLTGAAFVISARYPQNRLRWAAWAFALSGGATVAALRVAAGKHFYSDVITGAAAGTAVGLIVPALHLRRRRKKKDAVSLYPAGAGLVGSF